MNLQQIPQLRSNHVEGMITNTNELNYIFISKTLMLVSNHENLWLAANTSHTGK